MTEGQQRYQALLETQRHNLEMEKISQGELSVKKQSQALAETKHAWDVQLADYEKPAERAKNVAGAFASFGKGFADIIKGVSGLGALFS